MSGSAYAKTPDKGKNKPQSQQDASGVGQYVILGAGLDSFAYRRNDLLGRLRVFEAGHPATQSRKRRRLAGLGVELPDRLAFEARAAYFPGQADVEIAAGQRLVAAALAPASALSGHSAGQPA